MLKCYLANNRCGHFVTPREAVNIPEQIWSCVSCGCWLILHASTHADPPWFEHDQRTVAAITLMNCVHIDPAVKAEVCNRVLRSLINVLDVPMMSLDWYCVWCDNHYCGEKLCTTCGTGIYSIEEACWKINYT